MTYAFRGSFWTKEEEAIVWKAIEEKWPLPDLVKQFPNKTYTAVRHKRTTLQKTENKKIQRMVYGGFESHELRYKFRHVSDKEVFDMYHDQCRTFEEISETYNMPIHYVKRLVKRYGRSKT